jgi:hypothetical protein
MLSNRITAFLEQTLTSNEINDLTANGEQSQDINHDELDNDDADTEPVEVHITKDKDGNLYHCDQVDDYIYCDDQLTDINFYDFICCY